MSEEQLTLPFDAWSAARADWEPSDGQAAPLRRFDTPPAAIAASAFGEQCIACGRPFVPVATGQRRCARHQLEHDTAEAERVELQRGPDPRA